MVRDPSGRQCFKDFSGRLVNELSSWFCRCWGQQSGCFRKSNDFLGGLQVQIAAKAPCCSPERFCFRRMSNAWFPLVIRHAKSTKMDLFALLKLLWIFKSTSTSNSEDLTAPMLLKSLHWSKNVDLISSPNQLHRADISIRFAHSKWQICMMPSSPSSLTDRGYPFPQFCFNWMVRD